MILWVVIICVFLQSVFYIGVFSRLAYYKDKDPNEKRADLSILICYRNEGQVISSTLPCILNQDFEELMLINDHSTDDTEEKLKYYKNPDKNVSILSIDKETRGKKHALWTGIKYAKCNSILLTDADCRPSSDSWAQIMGQQSTSFVLGYGPMEKVKGGIALFSRYETYITALQYLNFALIGMPYMGVGRNLKMDRSLFFDNQDRIKGRTLASGDDDLMVNELAKASNTTICIDPNSFVYSHPKTTMSSFLHQKSRHISTAPHYKTLHKLVLGMFSGTHLLFYIALVVGLVGGGVSFGIGLILLGTKWMIQQMINYFCMKKLKEEDLIWKFPLLDIMYFVYLLILPLYYILNKNKTSWS